MSLERGHFGGGGGHTWMRNTTCMTEHAAKKKIEIL